MIPARGPQPAFTIAFCNPLYVKSYDYESIELVRRYMCFIGIWTCVCVRDCPSGTRTVHTFLLRASSPRKATKNAYTFIQLPREATFTGCSVVGCCLLLLVPGKTLLC